jgi:hypothetical protein
VARVAVVPLVATTETHLFFQRSVQLAADTADTEVVLTATTAALAAVAGQRGTVMMASPVTLVAVLELAEKGLLVLLDKRLVVTSH